MNRKPILHLFDNKDDLNYYMSRVISSAELDPALQVKVRNGEVITSFAVHVFRVYKGYDYARTAELQNQWGCVIIYFKSLPDHVIKHYLSRIRWAPR